MSAERGVSQDELLAWIEEVGDEASLADIGRRLALDPELEAWARGARADREGVVLMGEAHAREAPRGLWREALAEAERRALLVEEEVEPAAPVFTFRLTPVRLGVAAAVLLVVSLGTLTPLIMPSNQPVMPSNPPAAGSTPVARGPENELAGFGADHASFASRESVPASRSLMDSMEEARLAVPVQPRATLASFGDGWAADPNGLVAGRAMAGYGFGNPRALTPTRRSLPGAFPESWGLSREKARRLAHEGRLIVRVRTEDVGGYIARLQGAMGRRATLVDGGVESDLNGVASPASLTLRAPSDKLDRALRLCAIDAASMELSEAPATGRPGAWAEAALWWAGSDGEGEVALLVEPVGGADRLR